jgi:hypothetical protein
MATDPTKSDFFITQYYEYAFDRRPDTLGTYYWVSASDNGVSTAAIATAFVNSPEFFARYGRLTNEQFIYTLQSNSGFNFSATQTANWLNQLNNGFLDRGSVMYQMVDTAGIPEASTRLTFFGDSGTARAGGHQFYYENGGAAQHAMGAFFRTDGAFYGVTDVVSLGDVAYAAGSSTTYDDSVGSDFNQFMYPYPSPYYLKDKYLTTANYFNSGLQTNLIGKDYPATNIATEGNKVWPYNIYNYPLGYANPESGGVGGSPDGKNHFWPTPGNHDYGARVGYTDTNNTASDFDTAYPAGLTSTVIPEPYIDYFAFLRSPDLLGPQAKSISIGSADGSGNKGIYYSVELGDQGNGKPLIELFSIDTERLNSNAGINDELSDGYNGDKILETTSPNYFYDPSLPYNPSDINTVAKLTNDPANGQAQYNWLKSELQNSEAKWKILFGHQPIYSTGKMGNLLGTDHGSNPVLQNFLDKLVDEPGVSFDAWLNGHTHYYERVLEQNNNGIGQGIPFITNGNSGRSLYQTYQVDYGQSLYTPQNIDKNVYLNKITNFLQSDPVMAGVSAELRKFTVDPNATDPKKIILQEGPILPGTYGDGYGAVATAASKSYLLFDYVQTDVLDPAILANLNPATRSSSLLGWNGLTSVDWMPKSPSKADTAELDIQVATDGSIAKVKVDNAGAGYMSTRGGNATVDFEVRGNDSFDASKTTNPHNYAIVSLEFTNGSLNSATLKYAGKGYTHAAQAVIANGLNTYATIAPTAELLSKYPLELPINISVFAGDDNISPDTQYQDWYLITDTKANVSLKANGAITATVTVTPLSEAAIDVISTHDLTTGYSGVGQQQKFYAAQSGKISISDAVSGLVLGTGSLVNGVANFSLSSLPTSKEMKISFSGDPTSSYQINFKASDTFVSTDQLLTKSQSLPFANFDIQTATVGFTGLAPHLDYHLVA